ncbi:unnamed protein product, partial [Natator depressus]
MQVHHIIGELALRPTFLLGSAVSNIVCCLVFGSRFGYKDQEFLTLLSCINQNFLLLSSRWGQ